MLTIVTISLLSSNTRSKTHKRILKFVVSKSAIVNSVSNKKSKKEKIATKEEQLDLGLEVSEIKQKPYQHRANLKQRENKTNKPPPSRVGNVSHMKRCRKARNEARVIQK